MGLVFSLTSVGWGIFYPFLHVFNFIFMGIDEVCNRIRETKSTKCKFERLRELNFIAEDIANHFTESMSLLEYEIDFVLERTSQKIKDELGYHSSVDVTTDICVRPSWEY